LSALLAMPVALALLRRIGAHSAVSERIWGKIG